MRPENAVNERYRTYGERPAVTLSLPLIGFLSMNNRTYEKVKKMSISRGFLLAKTEGVFYNVF